MLLTSVCEDVNCGDTFKETFQLNLFYRLTTFFFTNLLIVIFLFSDRNFNCNYSFILFSCVASFSNNSWTKRVGPYPFSTIEISLIWKERSAQECIGNNKYWRTNNKKKLVCQHRSLRLHSVNASWCNICGSSFSIRLELIGRNDRIGLVMM